MTYISSNDIYIYIYIYIYYIYTSGTDLYLNGEMRETATLAFDRLNYLTFLATPHAQKQPKRTGHIGIDWSVGGQIMSRYSYSLHSIGKIHCIELKELWVVFACLKKQTTLNFHVLQHFSPHSNIVFRHDNVHLLYYAFFRYKKKYRLG